MEHQVDPQFRDDKLVLVSKSIEDVELLREKYFQDRREDSANHVDELCIAMFFQTEDIDDHENAVDHARRSDPVEVYLALQVKQHDREDRHVFHGVDDRSEITDLDEGVVSEEKLVVAMAEAAVTTGYFFDCLVDRMDFRVDELFGDAFEREFGGFVKRHHFAKHDH